ncbi:hypothetical protein BRAS3843_1480002 [Bradyrhizobium sp. STM 3843]|uniref:gp53 minor capsid family protein n=1 Tax=Bradyrhizobium sp. STM 3843 TaxID=551947 RepID=UPI000240AF60|nr:hypothetical protein [Bradyrhizobium sp. STM 3843]CCE05771.1 hypothetical protein BRAS3843_1480002 [Bradyrhizobium sp. STM 3843]
MGGFQTVVNTQPAPAVEGDFCNANPRFSVDAGPGGLVAGDQGAIVGRFAWLSFEEVDANDAPAVVNNFGSGSPAGFVHREQQGLITGYLQESSMVIPRGFQMSLMARAGLWARNAGNTEALPGMKAYANFADGTVLFAPSGTVESASVTGSIAPATAAVTGSINDNILNVSAVTNGTLYPGATIGGAGVAAGTKIVEQLDGIPGGVGDYALNIGEQNVQGEAINATYGVLSVTAVASGKLALGDSISASGITAGTSITAFITGNGGLGTYVVDPTQTFAAGTITVGIAIETGFYARSAGAPGELVKIDATIYG